MEKVVKFKKLTEFAEIPTYAHDGDIGLDVKCVSVEYDRDNDVYICGTGLACETEGHMGIHGMMKSGIYKRGDCYLTNGVGLIDSDQFRGEIKFIYRSRVAIWVRASHSALSIWGRMPWWKRLFSNYEDIYERELRMIENHILEFSPYHVGDVCGQLVPLTFDKIEVQEVKELSETERGIGGFGSTDKKNTKKKKKVVKKVKD